MFKLRFLVAISLLFISCEPSVDSGIYKEKLVVFGNLKANRPLVDTVYVSLSSAINEAHESEEKWVSDARVSLSDGDTTLHLSPAPIEPEIPGRYIDSVGRYIVKPNKTYTLNVSWKDYHITATTTVPDTLHLSGIQSSDWECNGEPVWVDSIDLHLDDNPHWLIRQAFKTQDFSKLKMDTITYREGDCYTTSFASVPMFIVQWEAESDPGLIRVVSHSLENKHENAIFDTTLSATIFKGAMMIDEEGLYYRNTPVIWNLSQPILNFGWLSFNYYGVHMIEIQVADQNFLDYYRGFPMGPPQNQYILPDGNIEEGYGLFSSTFSRIFFVYIKEE